MVAAREEAMTSTEFIKEREVTPGQILMMEEAMEKKGNEQTIEDAWKKTNQRSGEIIAMRLKQIFDADGMEQGTKYLQELMKSNRARLGVKEEKRRKPQGAR